MRLRTIAIGKDFRMLVMDMRDLVNLYRGVSLLKAAREGRQ